jgi:hypothetical protein
LQKKMAGYGKFPRPRAIDIPADGLNNAGSFIADFSKANDSLSFKSRDMLFRYAKLGSLHQVSETLCIGLPYITPEYQMHELATTYDFDQSTITQFGCMMRERSRANLMSPEKASQRYRVPVSGYLLQNSNPARLGQGARDSSKLMICQLFESSAKSGPCNQ